MKSTRIQRSIGLLSSLTAALLLTSNLLLPNFAAQLLPSADFVRLFMALAFALATRALYLLRYRQVQSDNAAHAAARVAEIAQLKARS